jgi:hypothetical protein
VRKSLLRHEFLTVRWPCDSSLLPTSRIIPISLTMFAMIVSSACSVWLTFSAGWSSRVSCTTDCSEEIVPPNAGYKAESALNRVLILMGFTNFPLDVDHSAEGCSSWLSSARASPDFSLEFTSPPCFVQKMNHNPFHLTGW